MNYKEECIRLIEILKKDLEQYQKEFNNLPPGELIVVKNGKYLSYRIREDGAQIRDAKQIGKNKLLIDQLARKEYLHAEIVTLQEDIQTLSECTAHLFGLNSSSIFKRLKHGVDKLPNQFYRNPDAKFQIPKPSRDPSLQPAKPLLRLECISPEEWGGMPFKENTSFLENKTHTGPAKLKYRSKSEVGFSTLVFQLQIPHHPDELIRIGDNEVAPDNILARPDGILIYHEHRGIETKRYNDKFNWKLQLYASVGIIPGRNLLITSDEADGSLNLVKLRLLLDTFMSC